MNVIIFISFFLTSLSNLSGWQSFEAPNQEFVIMFPQKPTSAPKFYSGEFGTVKSMSYTFNASKEPNDNLMYSIKKSEFSQDHTNESELIAHGIKDAVEKVSGVLVSEKEIKHNSLTGKEIKISYYDNSLSTTLRFYAVQNILYTIQVVSETPKALNMSQLYFINSFQLKK